jgi:hemolysin III
MPHNTTPATSAPVEKPRLRGVLHQCAALIALGSGVVLIAIAPTARAGWSALAYVASMVLLFTVSAIYHRITWEPATRERMRRADHACIFALIAGTYTPMCLLALPAAEGERLIAIIWGGALLGILRVFAWRRAPRLITALPYLLLGWIMVLYWSDFREGMTARELSLMLWGGAVYSVGALAYALKRPEPIPGVFGHHEVFHACTLFASALHFSCVLSLVLRASFA